MIHQRTCTCEHHTDDQGMPTQCGISYGVFGHFGWGEPWISASRCGACHGCGTGRLGLNALPPAQHDVGAWVASPAADAMLGQHLMGLQRSSYSIRSRLAPRFVRARGLVREGVRLDGRCGHDHLFAVELPGHFRREGQRWTPSPVGHHHPDEERYVIGACEIIDDVERQDPECPLCGHSLHLMMHEGWIRSAGVGFDNQPRPYRVYYLTCVPDWERYRPNNPIASNAFAPPFNPHPAAERIGWSSRLSFWHSSNRSVPHPDWTC